CCSEVSFPKTRKSYVHNWLAIHCFPPSLATQARGEGDAMPRFMFDTNAFNRAVDSGADPKLHAARGQLFVTHVQKNELLATKNTQRLEALLSVFEAVEQETVPTAAMVWDVSEWGGAEWGD